MVQVLQSLQAQVAATQVKIIIVFTTFLNWRSRHGPSISCNMDRRVCMPKARGPQARGLRAYVHIWQIPTAHVTSDMYHFRHSKNQN